MQLFGALASPYVARVVLFARLKGIDLQPVMPEGGVKTSGFLDPVSQPEPVDARRSGICRGAHGLQ